MIRQLALVLALALPANAAGTKGNTPTPRRSPAAPACCANVSPRLPLVPAAALHHDQSLPPAAGKIVDLATPPATPVRAAVQPAAEPKAPLPAAPLAKAAQAPAPIAPAVDAAKKTEQALKAGDAGGAKAAQDAVFDLRGEQGRGLDISAPEVQAGPSDPSRTSGLSPPVRTLSPREAFIAANGPAVPDFLKGAGMDFDSVAIELMQNHTFDPDFAGHLEEALTHPGMHRQYAGRLVKAAEAIIKLADDAMTDNPKARAFAGALGRAYALLDHTKRSRSMDMDVPTMPGNPLGKGAYWDMASGLHAADYIANGELDRDTQYTFFDVYPFVTSYIGETARLTGAKNASVVEADIRKLERPNEPLSVLRVKNAALYAKGFEAKLDEMVDWIKPGGLFILQGDSGYNHINDQHYGAIVTRLLQEGWTMTVAPARQPPERLRMDTLYLRRPEGQAQLKTFSEAQRSWFDAIRTFQRAGMRGFGGVMFIFGR